MLLAADLLEHRVVERIVGGEPVAADAVHVDDADAGELPRPRDGQREAVPRRRFRKVAVAAPMPSASERTATTVKPGAPAQQACGVAEILPEAGEPDASVHIPGDLLHDHDVAELAADRGFGLGARLAPFHAVPYGHLDAPANLRVHGVGAAQPDWASIRSLAVLYVTRPANRRGSAKAMRADGASTGNGVCLANVTDETSGGNVPLSLLN